MDMRTGAMSVAQEYPASPIESASNTNDSAETKADRLRILVVDDHKLIADTLAEILENEGFNAGVAYNGRDAFEVVPRFRPNCILSDVLMPVMNGIELGIAIRKTYPTITIMLFSGQAGISELLLEGQRQGYEFELIAKPIHPLRLVDRLRQL